MCFDVMALLRCCCVVDVVVVQLIVRECVDCDGVLLVDDC